ncbi:MAG: hypothetical protein HY821_05875 [Acidobacteria bacterium]|nr:hypothetical protein [Acidobacteriota bacterium]
MILLLAALLAWEDGPVVRDPGADLRDSCSADAATVARLGQGTPLKIRFSLSGDLGACYKVEAGGAAGYLRAGEIEGLGGYKRGLQLASDRELPQMIRSEVTRIKLASVGQPAILRALDLMETSRPREALSLIESSLLPATGSSNASVLALAGLAAWQSDQPKRAAGYWAASLALQPDPTVERLYRKVQGELKSDVSRESLSGSRFDLRYDGAALNAAAAAQLLDLLQAESTRLEQALGCGFRDSREDKFTVIVQTADAYRASTGAEEWSGGQFDGRIRVILEPGRSVESARPGLAHELVHACLARNGRFDRWFHEGMAQRWSGEPVNAPLLREASHHPDMPDLTKSTEQAHLFYAWSRVAVDRLYSVHGDSGVRLMLRNPSSVPAPKVN